MKRLLKYIGILKYILIMFLIFFVVALIDDSEISNAKMENVAERVVKAIDSEELLEADNRMVKRLYGLNVNDYKNVVLYVSNSNMKVEELFLVKLKDTAQSESVKVAINTRLNTQLESFEGYGPEQCKLLKDHVLNVKGNYILYVVGKKAKVADKAFQKSL